MSTSLEPRKLAELGDQCMSILDCSGILNCCQGLSLIEGYGLCHPICDLRLTQTCDNTYKRCGASLKCCNGVCVDKWVPEEECLTSEELLDLQMREAAYQEYLKRLGEKEMKELLELKKMTSSYTSTLPSLEMAHLEMPSSTSGIPGTYPSVHASYSGVMARPVEADEEIASALSYVQEKHMRLQAELARLKALKDHKDEQQKLQ